MKHFAKASQKESIRLLHLATALLQLFAVKRGQTHLTRGHRGRRFRASGTPRGGVWPRRLTSDYGSEGWGFDFLRAH